MALGDYVPTTFNNGAPPARTAAFHTTQDAKINELDDAAAAAVVSLAAQDAKINELDDAAAAAVVSLATKVPKETTAAPGTPFGEPTIYQPDTLRASVEAASGGLVTVLYDDQGNPSYMRVIPKFMVEDIHADFGSGVHPAFIVNGVEKPYIFVGLVQASAIGARAVSIPGRDPWNSLNFDAARAACVAKGTGWHLMSNWEWAAISLWCLKNGFQPRGNTNYGRAHDATWETSPRYDNLQAGLASGTARSKGGLGPVSWRHDNSAFGISDMVGNIWEWQDGMKLVDGQILMPNDNYYGQAESGWTAQGVFMDSTGTTGTDAVATNNGAVVLSSARVTPSDDCGNGLGASAPDYDYTYIDGEAGWRSVTMSAGYNALAAATRQRMMQSLIAAKLNGSASAPFSAKGMIYARNYGERIPLRGGNWGSGASAGLSALYLLSRRSYAVSGIGFRPAFIG